MKNKYKKNILKTIKRILKYISGRELFIMSVVIFLVVINPVTAAFTTIILQKIVDNFIIPLSKNFDLILFEGFKKQVFLLFIIFSLDIIITFVYRRLMTIVSTSLLCKIRVDLFKKTEKLSIKFFDTHKRGDIMSVYTNDVDGMRQMITDGITAIIFDIVITIINFSLIFYWNLQLSLIILFTFFVICFIIALFTKKSKKMFKIQQNKLGKLNAFIEETIDGQKVIKTYNCENIFQSRCDKIADKLRTIATNADVFIFNLSPTVLGISLLNQAIILMLSCYFVLIGKITLGVAVVFIQRARALFFPINELAHLFNIFIGGIACSERIFDVLDQKDDIDDGEIVLNKEKIKGNILFDKVFLKYGEKDILKNVNINTTSGKKIALVGSTGAGKTTIVNLINRFYDVSDGTITFDNININNIKKYSLRENISIVLQDAYFFTGTIRENIRYGRLDATDEEVKQSAKMANANYFIKNLSQKYETILTNNAENLSQGEKQLLSIARAMISNRQILILDEATSSIDTRTEKLIEEGLNILMKNKTTFIIAHRLSTIRNADTIIVLEKGQIIEHGTHKELLENKSRYYQLYNGTIEFD
jgi:ATP-binding cassette subfamily B protein